DINSFNNINKIFEFLNNYQKTVVSIGDKKLIGFGILYSVIEYLYFYDMIKDKRFKNLIVEVLKTQKEKINIQGNFKEGKKQANQETKSIKDYSDKDDGFKHFRRGSSSDLKFDLASTEVGRFFKDMYDDLLKASPILRGIGWLTKLTTKLTQAVDVRYGSGRIASFLDRIEDLRENWVINLGDTEYSDLIRENQARKKYAKRPKEVEETSSKKIENVTKGMLGTQTRSSFSDYGFKMERKADSEKETDAKVSAQQTRSSELMDKKEEDSFKKDVSYFQERTKEVQEQQENSFKGIHERLSAIENMLVKLSQSEVNASVNTNINLKTHYKEIDEQEENKDYQEQYTKKEDKESEQIKKDYAIKGINQEFLTASCPDPNKTKVELQQKMPEEDLVVPSRDVDIESKREETKKILNEYLNNNKNLYQETMKNFQDISNKIEDIKRSTSKKDTISKSVFKNVKPNTEAGKDKKKDKKIQNLFRAMFGRLRSVENNTKNNQVTVLPDMPQEKGMSPKEELRAKRQQEKEQLREERRLKKEEERMRRKEKEEADKKQKEEEGGGFSLTSLLPILLLIGALPIMFLGGSFLFNFIKRLIFPEISFFNASSSEDIDSMIAEIADDDEKKNKIADALKKRLNSAAQISMNYANRSAVAEYAALSSGALDESNVYTQKEAEKPPQQQQQGQQQAQQQGQQAKQAQDNKQIEERLKALEAHAAATTAATKQEAQQVSQSVQKANENINVANQSVPNKPSEIN
ncbi:MAG: hypothetical protein NZZ41_07335, partial [Candidatus Dojkabacteria bacterium]|nr:hypothetical protein [Candidatus Dojkabacteria bacterium]